MSLFRMSRGGSQYGVSFSRDFGSQSLLTSLQKVKGIDRFPKAFLTCLRDIRGMNSVAIAGGCALNCVANGAFCAKGIFKGSSFRRLLTDG